jgi:hypothetical protein
MFRLSRHKSQKKCLLVLWMSIVCGSVFGQITVTFPSSRMVFQRDNSNQATLYVAGNYTQYVDKVEARCIARTFTPSQGTTTAWQTIQMNPTGGVFYGSMSLTGGWYDLEIRASFEGTIISTVTVERVGIGEVFVVAGQSNASGNGDMASIGNYGPSASDDRVNSVNFARDAGLSYANSTLPVLSFSQINNTIMISPFGTGAWCWGALGDLLVQQLNVPVAFFNTGWSGSPLRSWNESANDPNSTPAFVFNFFNFPAGMPYGNLRLALNFYGAQFGVRAVLWHQGESDNWEESSRNSYGIWLKNVIEKSRLHSGKSNLAWVVARVSRTKGFNATYSRIWQPVIDAQNDVVGINSGSPNYTPDTFAGPETDGIIGNNWRTMPDSLHFSGAGHTVHANGWLPYLNSSFFSNSTPYAAMPPPQIASNCVTANTLNLSSTMSGSNFFWANNDQANNYISMSNNITVGQGNYILKIADSNNNIVVSPKVSVQNSFTEIIPINSITSGHWLDTSTWSCGRVPTILDIVTIEPLHTITVPQNATGFFRWLVLNGSLDFQPQGKLSR